MDFQTDYPIRVRSRSGRDYFYDTSSNRLMTRLDDEHSFTPIHYEAGDEYIFTRIGMFTIEITQECNLRCSYCCYSGEYSNRRKHNHTVLSMENMERCVDFICRHSAIEVPVIYVAFYGGEALLRLDKIEWIIRELSQRSRERTYEFSISTNGTLLKPEIIDEICSIENLFVTITIDGDKEYHDRSRMTSSGNGTFDAIMSNLKDFKKRYPIAFRERVKFISTIKSIQDLIPLNDFWMSSDILQKNRPQHIASIIPNFNKGDTVSMDRIKFERIYDKGIEYIRKGNQNILTDEFFNLINTVRRREYTVEPDTLQLLTCINIPNSCFISSDGNLYVCERFCTQYKLGSVAEGFDENKCKELNQKYIHLKNKFCSECWARRLCRRCAMNLNYTEEQILQYCKNERMQIELALKYYCELKEFKHGLLF